MNIAEAIRKGQLVNKAVRQASWPTDAYLYHGMDNLMIISDSSGVDNERIVIPNAALFSSDDWELFDKPYHGRLAEPKTQQE